MMLTEDDVLSSVPSTEVLTYLPSWEGARGRVDARWGGEGGMRLCRARSMSGGSTGYLCLYLCSSA